MNARRLLHIIMLALAVGCIEPITYDVPAAGNQLVVDGFITNEQGPYVVKLSRNLRLNTDMDFRDPVADAIVRITSDAGENETLEESQPGVYLTSQLLGVVGRTYTLYITTKDGATYESAPEMIRPPGEVLEIRAEFEHRTSVFNGVEFPDDRFNVVLDSKSPEEANGYFRWKVVGTYKIETKPWLLTTRDDLGRIIPNPAPCSGWVLVNSIELPDSVEIDTLRPGIARIGKCSCCTCYVTEFEQKPQVSDEQFISGKDFRNVIVGLVPITKETFHEKYHVSVSQMSLSETTFEFFRLIKAQKDGATSLFQPAGGRLHGNIVRTNGEENVQGIFWAAGVSTKTMFINRSDVPDEYVPLPIPDIKLECYNLLNATTTKPSFWE